MPFDPPVTTQFRLSSVQHWDILSLSDAMTVAFGICLSQNYSHEIFANGEEVAARTVVVILPMKDRMHTHSFLFSQ